MFATFTNCKLFLGAAIAAAAIAAAVTPAAADASGANYYVSCALPPPRGGLRPAGTVGVGLPIVPMRFCAPQWIRWQPR